MKTLSDRELKNINAYLRVANYLSVGQLYLKDNPLLREKLTLDQIKPNVVGHWGTAPGQNFVYVHLNRIIKKYNLENQINIINDDATLTDIKEKYDLIFIDAAKGKNILFFEKYKDNLKEDGTIITDNLSFHGLVENPNLIKTKNQKGIVNKIKLFINFLDNNKEFSTIYIPVGDKIAISKRSKKYE